MGAYRYCEDDNCEGAMGKPTPREDLIEGQPCPRCGKLHFYFIGEAECIVQLWDELQELKNKQEG